MPHWPQSCFGSIFVSPSREHLIKAYLHMNASSVKGIQCVNCAKMRDELLSGRRNGNGNFRWVLHLASHLADWVWTCTGDWHPGMSWPRNANCLPVCVCVCVCACLLVCTHLFVPRSRILHSSASIPGFVVHFAGSAVAHSPASHALLSGGIAVLMVMMPPAALSLKLLCIAGTNAAYTRCAPLDKYALFKSLFFCCVPRLKNGC